MRDDTEPMELEQSLVAARESRAEADLIREAKDLDSAAWREIYHRYYRKMHAYVYYRIGDSAAAEDIAAQVFLEACRRIRSFTYRGVPLSAWLYRIAHNLATDYVRRSKRVKLEPLNPEAHSLPVADAAEQISRREELVSALRRLTTDQQQVIVMRFVEGMSVAAVAAAMGKTEEAVKALQHRAVGSLRRLLSGGREGRNA
ncbi:MAG: sigma-70 family RNA polymerase sigma factor [Chloroflexi bacterium]|nr:sigma-70 family RNA polymerase sigma factor [Chloroflexota bacterium]